MKRSSSIFAAALFGLTALVVAPQFASAKDLHFVPYPYKVRHLYVFNHDESQLETYSTVLGTMEIKDGDALHSWFHPTMKDKTGKSCSLVGIDPTPGHTTTVSWTNAFGDEPFVMVVGDQRFVLCEEELPNHDQLHYPPD